MSHPLGLALGRGVLPLSLARIPPAAPPRIRLKAGFPTPVGDKAHPSCWLAAVGTVEPCLQGMQEACQNADGDLPGPPHSLDCRNQLEHRFLYKPENSWEDSFEGLSGD